MAVVETVLVASFLLLTASLVLSLYNRFYGPHLHQYFPSATASAAQVSVLIPARNEARNLRVLLPLLHKSQLPIGELLVLDDNSDDETSEVAAELGAQVLTGKPLPPGWTGKNWAAWQLASRATGEILLFVDADVQPGPLAIARTVACMDRDQVDAMSVFPRQIYPTAGIAAVAPFIMELPVNSWLPLRLVGSRKYPYFTAANGQWMAIRRRTYDLAGGHQAIRSHILDDMELAKRLRGVGKFQTLLAADDISVRMYADFRTLCEGFTKNLYPLVGGNFVSFALFFLFFLVIFVVPLLALVLLPLPWGGSLMAMTLLWRVVVAKTMRSAPRSIVLHPWGVLGALYLLGLSAWRHWLGKNTWKGRALLVHSSCLEK